MTHREIEKCLNALPALLLVVELVPAAQMAALQLQVWVGPRHGRHLPSVPARQLCPGPGWRRVHVHRSLFLLPAHRFACHVKEPGDHLLALIPIQKLRLLCVTFAHCAVLWIRSMSAHTWSSAYQPGRHGWTGTRTALNGSKKEQLV